MPARPLDTGFRQDGDRRARTLLVYALVISVCGALLHHVPGSQSWRTWLLTPFQPILEGTGAVRSALIGATARGSGGSSAGESRDEAALRIENAALEARAGELEEELNALRASLGFEAVTGRRGVLASVSAGIPRFGDRTLVLDKGLLQGVRVGGIVLGASGDGRVGLVGRVIEVGPAMCKVLTVLDPSSRIAARLSGEDGFVYSGTSTGMAGRLDFVPRDMAIAVGDQVLTAPEGALFPAGFRIGEVASMGTGNGVFHDLRIRPAVDISRLRHAWVMTRQRAQRSSSRLVPDGAAPARHPSANGAAAGAAADAAAYAGDVDGAEATLGSPGSADPAVAPAAVSSPEARP